MNYTIILDGEYRYAMAAHARYQLTESFDPNAPDPRLPHERRKDPCITPRWPFRELVALSWLVLIEVDGDLVPLRLETRGLPEASEETIIREFFEDITSLMGPVHLVTWGGSAHDIPLLLLLAMRTGITLPSWINGLIRPKDRAHLPHSDLMELVCGFGQRVHLAEIASVMQIPVKVCCKADEVAAMMDKGKWSTVKSVAEGDVLTTWALFVRHRRLGKANGDKFTTDLRICQFVAENLSHRAYARDFAAWQQTIENDKDSASRNEGIDELGFVEQ